MRLLLIDFICGLLYIDCPPPSVFDIFLFGERNEQQTGIAMIILICRSQGDYFPGLHQIYVIGWWLNWEVEEKHPGRRQITSALLIRKPHQLIHEITTNYILLKEISFFPQDLWSLLLVCIVSSVPQKLALPSNQNKFGIIIAPSQSLILMPNSSKGTMKQFSCSMVWTKQKPCERSLQYQPSPNHSSKVRRGQQKRET